MEEEIVMKIPPTSSAVSALGLTAVALSAQVATAQVVADAGPDQVVDIAGGCSAAVDLDGSGSQAGPGATYTWTGPFAEGMGEVAGQRVSVTLAGGVHTVTLTVREGVESSTDALGVEVRDRTPPVIESVSPTPSFLWPPNHRLVDVEVAVVVTDNCDESPSCVIASIESDEPENGRGDGNTSPDAVITGALTAQLRSERSGPGDGRIYTIGLECTDDSGNVSRSAAFVRVPHDLGGGGDGEGTCKIRVNFERLRRNRLHARLDVSAASSAIPENDSSSRLDDLDGYELTLHLAGVELNAVVSEDGVAAGEDFTARWLPARSEFVIDVRDLDLAAILDLERGDRRKRTLVPVPFVLEVREVGQGSEPIVLFDGDLLCECIARRPRRGGGPGPAAGPRG
jgi:hypothetical protein